MWILFNKQFGVIKCCCELNEDLYSLIEGNCSLRKSFPFIEHSLKQAKVIDWKDASKFIIQTWIHPQLTWVIFWTLFKNAMRCKEKSSNQVKKIKFSQLLERWFSLLGSAFHKFKYRWSYNSWWAATILSQQMMCFEWSSICAFNLTNEMRIDIIINKIYYSLVD